MLDVAAVARAGLMSPAHDLGVTDVRSAVGWTSVESLPLLAWRCRRSPPASLEVPATPLSATPRAT